MRLETEMWRPMPLAPSWQLQDLKELQALKTPPHKAPPRLQCHTLFAAAPLIPAGAPAATPAVPAAVLL